MPEPYRRRVQGSTDVRLIRHGQTQGYCHRRRAHRHRPLAGPPQGPGLRQGPAGGHEGQAAPCPDPRAYETAVGVHEGLLQGAARYGIKVGTGGVEITDPTEAVEFDNFQVYVNEPATREMDVTAAFRHMATLRNTHDASGAGEREGWYTEVDRFYKIQAAGGDPITQWLNIPLLYVEPPVHVIRRFWEGIHEVRRRRPGQSAHPRLHPFGPDSGDGRQRRRPRPGRAEQRRRRAHPGVQRTRSGADDLSRSWGGSGNPHDGDAILVGMNFEAFATLVRSRRTSMLVDKQRDVPVEIVEHLCDLAQWAPNHKRTWPWRFTLLTGDSRSRLGETVAAVLAANGEEQFKVDKARTKYLRTPATLVVGSGPGDSPTRTAENRDAVAAGMQNLLLGATTLGLASYWGSCPKGANDPVAELCGFEAGTFVVSLTYLGYATSPVEPPIRPAVSLHHLS